MTRAVVFDLDGTLLNTLDDLADSANFSLSRRGYPIHETERYKIFVGNGVDTLMERILPENKRTPEEVACLMDIFAKRYAAHSLDKTRPYDGILKLLRALGEREIKTAVVSNKPDPATKQVIFHFFGEDTFDVVAGGGAGFPLKPDPALTVHTLSSMEIPPADALFVGDTMMDMRTAKSAGCVAVGVTWGFRTRDELLKNGADHIIGAPEELIGLL
ncbi:MAG: HAD family hydrolase [Synergistaceae bacterium]|jgi:phosphoglycolate phosphatase|nr:HAD family hydrolase [Synergistaceae bacterium]